MCPAQNTNLRKELCPEPFRHREFERKATLYHCSHLFPPTLNFDGSELTPFKPDA